MTTPPEPEPAKVLDEWCMAPGEFEARMRGDLYPEYEPEGTPDAS